ncbi:hypothetical protein DWY31_11900 [Dorea sp. AF24-7LB]|uniref:hypothetical protein n=1 Tax=Dorea sp. AF24-7LB TaxID=2293097 RepID=UPI000E477DB1|nr:hypothetical protein [Dorea sp. AF24-7LB]RHQ53890.1 hypothetical protein DWY31_11900 [Dorea sp. AF24-7LB]
MDDVRYYGELALVREGIEKIHEALPDYKYVPMRDVREAMYPEKMTTEQLAEALDEIAEAFDSYEYRDNVEPGENTVQEVMLDLQSFCSLEEKGVKERREQQVAERNEGRADERVISTGANAVVKEAGKTDRKTAQQKQTVDGKDKKLSIHERLEINKKIIQEKQGKDKPERGADFGVR